MDSWHLLHRRDGTVSHNRGSGDSRPGSAVGLRNTTGRKEANGIRPTRKPAGRPTSNSISSIPIRKKIEKTKAYVDSRIELIDSGESPTKGWYYCDTLYVGPPTLAMLGKATGDAKYYDYLNRVYWAVTDLLYDEEHHLFYRDTKYLDAKTPAGRKVFWSRGNGWVLGGLPRILQFLPKENEHYQRYVELFQTMATEIASRQEADGLWRANLDDPAQYPNPETSGTAFFCYAMAWGVNNGLLDRDTFVPVVMRAWGGLTRYVHPDGKLGYVQPVGADPKPATADMTHEYAMGLFLLAGEEMVKLLQSGVVSAEEIAEFEKECREETEHGRWSSKTASPDSARAVDMPLSDNFRRLKAPETGRTAIQLSQPDREYLEAWIYPMLKEGAKFYVAFMDRCKRDESGKVRLALSYSPEHGKMGIYNCPFDIAYVHYTFDAFVLAADKLGRDADLAADCRRLKRFCPTTRPRTIPTANLWSSTGKVAATARSASTTSKYRPRRCFPATT